MKIPFSLGSGFSLHITNKNFVTCMLNFVLSQQKSLSLLQTSQVKVHHASVLGHKEGYTVKYSPPNTNSRRINMNMIPLLV